MCYFRKILLLIVNLVFISTAISANDCSYKVSEKPVKIIFKTNYGKPKYNQVDQDFLIQKAGSSHARGLTESHFQMSYELRVRGEKGCLFLDALTVHYGYPNLDVFISNKYKEDSCEYKQILSHENNHVFIHQDTLRKYARQFGDAIKNIAQNIPAESFKVGVKNADKQINRMILRIKNHKQLSALEKSFENERKNSNQELDASENYQKITNKCKNW